jgi:hypothetical protein
MADLVRLHVLVTAEQCDAIKRFMVQFGIKTRKEAVRKLIEFGLKHHNATR